jgi:hypothetical protein
VVAHDDATAGLIELAAALVYVFRRDLEMENVREPEHRRYVRPIEGETQGVGAADKRKLIEEQLHDARGVQPFDRETADGQCVQMDELDPAGIRNREEEPGA